ncbi:MAG: hypothetical protein QMD85_05695 [Candidatus Aenigmarchaeota archaeon]|nr:hypothetical protein [Candidatus Aenigmarchaeota archaeon]
MDFQEKLLLALYAAIIVFIAIEFFGLWNLAVVLFGIVAIGIVQKMSLERKMKKIDSSRNRIVDLIAEKIDLFSRSVDSLKTDFSRSIEFLDNKINVVNHIYEGEMKKGYLDISSRISSFEERIEKLREALDAVYSNIDSRLASIENRDKEA